MDSLASATCCSPRAPPKGIQTTVPLLAPPKAPQLLRLGRNDLNHDSNHPRLALGLTVSHNVWNRGGQGSHYWGWVFNLDFLGVPGGEGWRSKIFGGISGGRVHTPGGQVGEPEKFVSMWDPKEIDKRRRFRHWYGIILMGMVSLLFLLEALAFMKMAVMRAKKEAPVHQGPSMGTTPPSSPSCPRHASPHSPSSG